MNPLKERSLTFIDKICQKNKQNRRMLSDFLLYCSSKGIDVESLCGNFLQEKTEYLFDNRERRHIYITQEEKQEMKKQTERDDDFVKLGKSWGLGYKIFDSHDIHQTEPSTDEDIITIFPEGGIVYKQKPGGFHLIIPKTRTLKFILETNELFFVDSDTAEQEDDKNPGTTIFIDGSHVSRKYKFIYSIKDKSQLYNYLNSIL